MCNSMFDELKEVLYRNNKFQEPCKCKTLWRNKTFKESSSLQGAYLEPKQASTMELFCEYT